jgi:energy-coupling factor transporter ATP-binding protein EcfA2
MNDNSIVINLSYIACKSEVEVLNSEGFRSLISKFTSGIDDSSNRDLAKIVSILITVEDLIEFFKLLLVLPFEDACHTKEGYEKFLDYRCELVVFVEALYDFWREFERYGIIQRQYIDIYADNMHLVDSTTDFWRNNLNLYRKILGRLVKKPITIFRQTPGGFNAGFIVSKPSYKLPKGYEVLNDIEVVNGVVIRTPFIGHSLSNKRQGIFQEVDINPVTNLKITNRHWLLYPIKVGDLLVFVYFHRTLLHHGVSLSNLFEPGFKAYFEGQKPNCIYVFGSHEKDNDNSFYIDKENDFYVGYVSREPKNDYFGYMKKMILTLHNVYMIKHQMLPIHGAMVNIILKNNKETNIVIIGDSGAGKSETLEALRFIADKDILEMNVIFDDMGIFYKRGNEIFAKGTETGAFIRLDDLDTGYAYKELDRAIFLNPEQNNARVILPLSTYDFIVKEHRIDMVLYANNYEDSKASMRFFKSAEEALPIFIEGKRKAKGTTAEKGIVTSFFANPFGPVQLKSETKPVIEDYLNKLFANGILIGELYTKLAIEGKENQGVNQAAKAILKLLKTNEIS